MATLFFAPCLAATSIGVGCVFKPLTVAMYGVTGALQGIVGAYALTSLGYSSCSIAMAASIGCLAGAAIAAPFAIAGGLKSIFENSDNEQSFLKTIAEFTLEIAVVWLASLIISTGFYLGTAPALTVAAGAVITNASVAAVKDVASCIMSYC